MTSKNPMYDYILTFVAFIDITTLGGIAILISLETSVFFRSILARQVTLANIELTVGWAKIFIIKFVLPSVFVSLEICHREPIWAMGRVRSFHLDFAGPVRPLKLIAIRAFHLRKICENAALWLAETNLRSPMAQVVDLLIDGYTS